MGFQVYESLHFFNARNEDEIMKNNVEVEKGAGVKGF